jgi:methyl-accepting chemotaxis protein
MTRGVFNELCLVAETSPDWFLEESRIRRINEELLTKFSYLAVEKDGEIIFAGKETHFEKIARMLPEAEWTESVAYDGGIYIGGETPFLAKQQNFRFSDGSEGSFSIITDGNAFVEKLKSTATFAIMWGILVIVATAVILVGWLYMGILRPLNALKKATHQLQEGNLDFSLRDSVTEDEVGQLCRDFEEMRIHLKEEKIRFGYFLHVQ